MSEKRQTCPHCGQPYKVGGYFADYTPLTHEEIATPTPDVDELFKSSRPLPEQGPEKP